MKKTFKTFLRKLKRKKQMAQLNKVRFSLTEVVLLLFVTLVFGVMIGYFSTSNLKKTSEIYPESILMKVYNSLVNNYYDDISTESLEKAAIKGMMDYLDDDNTHELSDSLYNDMKDQINGYFCGIGVSVIYENNNLEIIKVIEDSAADKIGLKVNDIITKVDNINVDSDNYIDLIKGKCNQEVKLTIIRKDKELTFNIIREPVYLEHISSQYFDVNDKYIGYIDINAFSHDSYDNFLKHLNRLEDKKISSLIIDLRDNLGGVVLSTRKIMNLFFDKNTTLYSTKSRNKTTIIKDSTSEMRSYPVVILMNESTASSAEILISCFQDNYPNVKLVGKHTFGKNTIQTNLSLMEDYGIKYTVSEWYTSKGISVKDKGIIPDIEVVSGGINYYDDTQLQAAIDLLKK